MWMKTWGAPTQSASESLEGSDFLSKNIQNMLNLFADQVILHSKSVATP